MKIHAAVIMIVCLCTLVDMSSAQPPRPKPGLRTVEDLRTQLAGTSWKVVRGSRQRPGLTPVLTFTEKTVAPAGYLYDVNSPSSLTIHFNHGDTQLMLLVPNANRLKFTFQNREYLYELAGD